LRREHLGQMSDAQQFHYARCHIGEFKDASPFVDCGHLEANQRSEARAIQMFYIAKVDDDATAKKDEGPHHFFYLARGVTDQLAMTLDCRHLIAVFVFIFRKFTVEGTISRHSPAVSFSDSTDRLTDLETTRVLLPTVLCHLSRDFIRWLKPDHSTQNPFSVSISIIEMLRD
jgi:hypothetical protein